jgi:hypothetical protein
VTLHDAAAAYRAAHTAHQDATQALRDASQALTDTQTHARNADGYDAAAWDAASKAKDRLAAANTAASKAMWAMWAAKDDLAQAALAARTDARETA